MSSFTKIFSFFIFAIFLSVYFVSSVTTKAATLTQTLTLKTANYVENGVQYSDNVSYSGNNDLRFSASNRRTHYFGTNNPNSVTHWAARFEGQEYPHMGILESAYLEVVAGKNHTNPVDILVYAENTDAPESYSNLNKPGDREEITSGHAVSITESWTKQETYYIDVTDAVYEMFDNGSFGDISIILKNNGATSSLRYIQNDYDHRAPRLILNYTLPDEPQPPTDDLKVIEVRHFANQNHIPYHPDQLSSQLVNAIEESSRFHGYSDPFSEAKIDVEIVDVININAARTSAANWEESFNNVLTENNLCSRIANEDIDQVWLWVDPQYDTVPGAEYAISSTKFQGSTAQYATVPSTPFCNGNDGFVFMGFDYTRTYDLALHSFTHMLEGFLGNAQGVDLFWTRYTENSCGNVHYPPNGAVDYDYANTSYVNTSCKDWNPNNTGVQTQMNCTEWNCDQGTYLKWWMQNMPDESQSLSYEGKLIPSWLQLIVNFEDTIDYYKYHGFWINPFLP